MEGTSADLSHVRNHADIPQEGMREAVARAAKYGARQGYLAAVRDIADEQQKHNGDALKVAMKPTAT